MECEQIYFIFFIIPYTSSCSLTKLDGFGTASRPPLKKHHFFHSQLSYQITYEKKNLVTFEFSKINTVAKKKVIQLKVFKTPSKAIP